MWEHLWPWLEDLEIYLKPLNRTDDHDAAIPIYVLDGFYPTTLLLPGPQEAFQRLAQQDCLTLQEFGDEVSYSPTNAWKYLSSFCVDVYDDANRFIEFNAGLLSSLERQQLASGGKRM
mgnify:CR=1 FL=1